MVAETKITDGVHAATRRVQRIVKAREFGVGRTEDLPRETTRELPEEHLWKTVADQIIAPPFDLLALAKMPELSSEMQPAIDAMAANIPGFGFRFVPLSSRPADLPEAARKEARLERIFLQNFFNFVAMDRSFTRLRKETRDDLEATGNGYWEVVRNRADRIVGLNQIPAYQMRLGYEDRIFTEVEVPVLTLLEDDTYEIKRITQYRRFRPYLQGATMLVRSTTRQGRFVESYDPRRRWFKTFGDPRVMNNETGEIVPPEEVADWNRTGRPMPEHLRASEVIHFRIYSARTPYGIPRWIGSLLAALGVRAAEETNYATLRNNNVPSMIITVSGGALTKGSIERIKSFAELVASGQNYSRFLLLEGESEFETDNAGQVRIAVTPLTASQHTDALFVEYQKMGRDSLRRAWRIPPILVGISEAYNKATADTARRIADEQVFGPERADEDWIINNVILADLGIKYHRFESKTPNVTDNRELISMLTAAEKTGAVNPRIGRAIIEDVFPAAAEAPPIDASGKFDPDVPWSLTMAQSVKNLGGSAGPAEINQSVAPVQPSGVVKGDEVEILKGLLDLGDRATDEIRRSLRLVKG